MNAKTGRLIHQVLHGEITHSDYMSAIQHGDSAEQAELQYVEAQKTFENQQSLVNNLSDSYDFIVVGAGSADTHQDVFTLTVGLIFFMAIWTGDTTPLSSNMPITVSFIAPEAK